MYYRCNRLFLYLLLVMFLVIFKMNRLVKLFKVGKKDHPSFLKLRLMSLNALLCQKQNPYIFRIIMYHVSEFSAIFTLKMTIMIN